ncbi:flagellar protein FlaG [Paenibacillus sp. PR3]|uniref:Flagellar protein FlaG n=1 Tax=Paenibacillus terricola TaxID=2763503 RepID=A0ABR8N0H5_9BACL|nr:flagellar protein FlaG [Paenibacillus terricola]MBD3920827.1 flagellar protein FlaG [Paenibacillus terricola]
MEISTQVQPVQSQTFKESASFQRVAGEYQVLKVKGKTNILSVSEQALVKAIEKANRAVQGTEHTFHYKIHEATHDVIVQILDKKTNEVVHEIPSEKFIDLIEKLKELTVGAIIDEKR